MVGEHVRHRRRGTLADRVGNCGVFAGRTGIIEPEIGYEIRFDSLRRGYATEAATAAIAECARVGLRRIWATVRPSNNASLHVLSRIGMTLDHREEDEKGTLLFLSRVP
jgi:ribosomal-protein-alanine N-acetyltransferase